MEIILLCLYGKVTVIVIFLIIYLYWIWKKVRLIKWEQAPGDTRDWIRNHEKNIIETQNPAISMPKHNKCRNNQEVTYT